MRQSWQYLYQGKAWRALRLQVLADEPLCRMCAAIGFAEGATVVDHIKAHKGEQALFWDRDNLQALCKPCHDRHAQRRDRGGDADAIGLDGWPVYRDETGRKPRYEYIGPEWLAPSRVPLVIVCGAPASGKSTFVRANAKTGDLIICTDTIAAGMGIKPRAERSREQVAAILGKRDALLRKLSTQRLAAIHKRAWFIATLPLASHRQWWSDKLAPERFVVINPGRAECMARAKQDAANGDARSVSAMKAIDRWHKQYTERAGDEVHA